MQRADPHLEAALAAIDAAREVLAGLAAADVARASPAAEELPLTYRFEQAAKQVGMSRTAVYEAVRKGHLAAVEMPGGGRRIRRRDLEAFVDALPTASSAAPSLRVVGERR